MPTICDTASALVNLRQKLPRLSNKALQPTPESDPAAYGGLLPGRRG